MYLKIRHLDAFTLHILFPPNISFFPLILFILYFANYYISQTLFFLFAFNPIKNPFANKTPTKSYHKNLKTKNCNKKLTQQEIKRKMENVAILKKKEK